MTTEEIRKRLEDAGLTVDGDLSDGYAEVRGFASAWRKALGPTKEQAYGAFNEALQALNRKSGVPTASQVGEVILSTLARLYP